MQYCLRPGCAALVARGYCPRHAPDREANRPNPIARGWYHSKQWRAVRARCLRLTPVCGGFGARVPCGNPTTEVDHIDPHRGVYAVFWDGRNLQALCGTCHATKTGSGL
jgi:5-methylcytosine-specific restriction protein A